MAAQVVHCAIPGDTIHSYGLWCAWGSLELCSTQLDRTMGHPPLGFRSIAL